MLRALSTRRNYSGYEKLDDDPVLEAKLNRATSVPASRIYAFDPSNKSTSLKVIKPHDDDDQVKTKPNKKVSKTHPIFSFFDVRRKKKTSSKAEFVRYLEYVKEGGVWDKDSNMPTMHYK